ncbi:hypothetical protein ANAEL_05800 [Anaerolineales bacterium]|nr:hypothetical protein ANAEL_05800 [Anaerolineales bacterium]
MPSISDAIAAIKSGRGDEARAILTQILLLDQRNVTALLWMTEVAETAEDRRKYLRRILEIDPNNSTARKGIQLLESTLPKTDEEPLWMSRATLTGIQPLTPQNNTTVNEVTYYADEIVAITNARAIFRGKTYSLANITSVEMGLNPPENQGCAAVALLAGCVLVLMGIGYIGGPEGSSILGYFAIGALALFFGIAILRNNKANYVVKVSSASGESNALASPDQQYIQKIVDAVNDAIVKRG